MFSAMIPFGGALVVLGLVGLMIRPQSRRARLSVMLLAISGVGLSEYGYLRAVRADRTDHDAVLQERTLLCKAVADDIVHHRRWIVGGQDQFTSGEREAALSSLEREVSNTWRICVRKDSECGAMFAAMVGDGKIEKLDAIQRCYETGPTPLESARIFLEN